MDKAQMGMHLKARETIFKLGEHPATPDLLFPILSCLWMDIEEVCKRGYSHYAGKKGVSIHYTPENYKKYKEEFDKELSCLWMDIEEVCKRGHSHYAGKKELKLQQNLVCIEIPYEELFGEPWKSDHIEYWGEFNFKVFIGNNFKKYWDDKNWQSCSAVDASGRTFEEMIVNIGEKFFHILGRFTDEDFLTPSEIRNHKKEEIFLHKKLLDTRSTQLISNPKYKFVNCAEINRRWVKWFVKTDYCRKHWKKSMQSVLVGKNI